MKKNETEYLNRLFAPSSGAAEEDELEFPLIDAPKDLSNKLYAIAEPTVVVTKVEASPIKLSFFQDWPKVTSIAASLLVAIMGVQFYQQQQTLNQLEKAQADLATALHYLGEANRITRAQVLESLNENVKAGVKPAMTADQETVSPDLNSTPEKTNTQTRTL